VEAEGSDLLAGGGRVFASRGLSEREREREREREKDRERVCVWGRDAFHPSIEILEGFQFPRVHFLNTSCGTRSDPHDLCAKECVRKSVCLREREKESV
jgi:hypothetical protein